MLATDHNSYVYQRDLEGQSAIVAISLSPEKTEISIPEDYRQEALVAGNYYLDQGKLTLMPYSGVVLTKE